MASYVEFLKLTAELSLVGMILNHFLLYRKSNDAFKKENDIFEKFLKRLDPNDMQNRGTFSNLINFSNSLLYCITTVLIIWRPSPPTLIQLYFPAAPTLLATQGESKMTRKKGKARGGSSGERHVISIPANIACFVCNNITLDTTVYVCVCRMLKLTAEQKCDIATRELDELHEEVERKREEWERLMASHWAVVEETRKRTDEIKKHHYEFERDVIRGGVNSVSGQVVRRCVPLPCMYAEVYCVRMWMRCQMCIGDYQCVYWSSGLCSVHYSTEFGLLFRKLESYRPNVW